ncbi:MAG TPA: cytochrome b/b6 domain-containing protein [Panacibacter sp.]|nr:cytochrome b/b6 domain-containing protein [Panacibacter sp.]HNP44364.1 cytochrome b/b6 domain-containing protein [Panacibacter sp.]
MSISSSVNNNNGHRRWVKLTHWIGTVSFLVLLVTGIEILMVHPRLYWGDVGNDLTKPLFELPISRNYQHGGWDKSMPFFDYAGSPVSAGRTYDIFNQNGWGRSLHFLSAWILVITGVIYLLIAAFSGHMRRNLWPRFRELSPKLFYEDVVHHLRLKVAFVKGPQYGLLQKISYVVVIFLLLPVIVLTGLTMSPAVTAACPWLLTIFFGAQSARTIHFFAAVLLLLFLLVHVVMIARSGFKQHMRAMTFEK